MTRQIVAQGVDRLVFSSLVIAALFGGVMEFLLIGLIGTIHDNEPWGILIEIVLVPLGMLIVYPFCLVALVSCANAGIWGYGSAVLVGAVLGFAIPALFAIPSEGLQILELIIAGAHGSIMYGVPGALIVLYRLSSRNVAVLDAVFGVRPSVTLSMVLAPLALMIIWHYFMARFGFGLYI